MAQCADAAGGLSWWSLRTCVLLLFSALFTACRLSSLLSAARERHVFDIHAQKRGSEGQHFFISKCSLLITERDCVTLWHVQGSVIDLHGLHVAGRPSRLRRLVAM